MDVDTEGGNLEATCDIDPSTPLAISIGGSASDANGVSNALRSARAESFSRSHPQIDVDSSGGGSSMTASNPTSPSLGSTSSAVPIVSVPSAGPSSSKTRPNAMDAYSASSGSGGSSAHADSLIGPSAMTRPRLVDLPQSAHHSESSAAPLQKVRTHLDAPYESTPSASSSASSSQDGFLPRSVWYDASRPDPLMDITRLRMPPRGKGCLYPGALFRGTQKSGKISYDVTVEILNVDLPNSLLEGYLNIRGLTADWPELTTFFSAEIIGMDHGFVTGRWGAKEADDMKHWTRFHPYKSLRKSIGKTATRFNHLNKPYVFMRWKERFLVPDWKVRDITGASFAGFYYVCAEFGDMSEWTMGRVDPETTQLGMSARASANLHASAVPSPLGTSPAVTAARRRRQRSSSGQSDGRGDNPGDDRGSSSSSNPLPSLPEVMAPPATTTEVYTLGRRRLGSGGGSATPSSASSPSLSSPLASSPSSSSPSTAARPRRNIVWGRNGPINRTPNAAAWALSEAAQAAGAEFNRQQELERAQRIATAAATATFPRRPNQPADDDGAARYAYLHAAGTEYVRALRRAGGEGTGGVGSIGSGGSSTGGGGAGVDVHALRSRALGGVGVGGGGEDDEDEDEDEDDDEDEEGDEDEDGEDDEGDDSDSSSDATTPSTRTSPGKITAFYYHENSEPYQQLDLRHVPQQSMGSFEMR